MRSSLFEPLRAGIRNGHVVVHHECGPLRVEAGSGTVECPRCGCALTYECTLDPEDDGFPTVVGWESVADPDRGVGLTID